MIYRLTYYNKEGIEARVDIQKGSSTPVIEVEGTERPFILSYNNDKGDKSGMFLSSSADIEIYETPDFNIDNLKTSNETELAVTHYINNVISWKGFIIPDFFSIEVGSNPVITMTASDRLGTLKNVTLSDLPSTISLRELAILCLNKTGLTLPLRTMADFNSGTGTNDFFNSKILTQRLSDTKGRSISCYDILSSILTASNSFLVQRSGGWHIINKIQHEAGSGKLYTGERTFVNWSDVIFNFSDISTGGRRTIIPVASTVGVYHEHGGGRLHPDNYDFSKGLTGWSAVGDFTASIDNRQIDGFQTQGGQAGYFPIYGAETENSYLVNYNQYERNVNPKYLESAEITIPYNGSGAIEVEVDVNATGPLTYPGSSFAPATLRISVVAVSGTETLTLDHSGKFIPMPSANPPIFSKDFGKALPINDVYKADSIGMKVKGTLEAGSLENYKLKVRIYGGTGGRTILVNMVSLSMKNTQELPKGNIYKTEKGDNFTKAHDIDTSLFGDYLTAGLNGYFYNYPIDDTSSLYNSNDELTSKWTAYNDTEQLPLLQHITRQKSRLFSVAHDLLSAELEATHFDPLAIFVACEKRYTVVSAKFDFFKSNISVELEEVAFQNNVIREYIYSYFGDGESGIKSIGGISGGGGGGSTGGGLTPEQLEILSFWKKDPDRENTIFTEMNAYSTKELSAYGLGSGSGGGGGGTAVSWGTEANGGVGLTVDGIIKTLALKSGLDLKQDKLIAGTGISIVGNTISSTATGGGITSIGLTAPTGFTVSNSPITSSGNLALSFASGYSLPTTAKQGQWDSAVADKHTHANKSVLDGITSSKVSNWDVAFTNNHTHANKLIIDKLKQSDIDVLAKLSLVNGNLQIDTNVYSTGEISAYGLGEGSGGGGGGSLVSWGTTTNNFVPLTVEGISKIVALQGHTHTKAQIGLNNVDNTSDLSKPISTATQTALNSKFDNPTGTTAQYIRGDGSLATYTDTTYFLMSLAELNTGTATTNRVVNSKNLNDWLDGKDFNFRKYGLGNYGVSLRPTTQGDFRPNSFISSSSAGNSDFPSYGAGIQFGMSSTRQVQLFYSLPESRQTFYFRSKNNTSDWSNIHKLWSSKEFTNSDVTNWNNKVNRSGDTMTGNLTAPTFIGNLQGNAATATKLQTARTIAGVSFDGTANIAIPFANLSSKPTTLGGYGITDAVTLNTAQTITGLKTFNASIILSVNREIRGTDSYAGVWNVNDKLWRFGSSSPGSVSNIRSVKVGVGTDSPSEKLHVVGNILATGTTTTPKVIFNSAGWSMEQVGSELQMKHNNVLKMRFTSTGSIVATEEITAFG